MPTNLEGSIRKHIFSQEQFVLFSGTPWTFPNRSTSSMEKNGKTVPQICHLYRELRIFRLVSGIQSSDDWFQSRGFFTVFRWFLQNTFLKTWIPRSKFLPLPTSPCHSTALHCHANDGGCAVGCSRYLVKRVFFWQQWKMDPLKMYLLLKLVVFHCYASLPEGNPKQETLLGWLFCFITFLGRWHWWTPTFLKLKVWFKGKWLTKVRCMRSWKEPPCVTQGILCPLCFRVCTTWTYESFRNWKTRKSMDFW